MKENLLTHKPIEECEAITSTQKYVIEFYKSKLLNNHGRSYDKNHYGKSLKSTWNISEA